MALFVKDYNSFFIVMIKESIFIQKVNKIPLIDQSNVIKHDIAFVDLTYSVIFFTTSTTNIVSPLASLSIHPHPHLILNLHGVVIELKIIKWKRIPRR